MICLTSLGLQRNKHSQVFFKYYPTSYNLINFPIFCGSSFAKMFSTHLLYPHLCSLPACIPTKIPSAEMLQRRHHPRFVSESSATSARRDSMGRLRLRPVLPPRIPPRVRRGNILHPTTNAQLQLKYGNFQWCQCLVGFFQPHIRLSHIILSVRVLWDTACILPGWFGWSTYLRTMGLMTPYEGKQ